MYRFIAVLACLPLPAGARSPSFEAQCAIIVNTESDFIQTADPIFMKANLQIGEGGSVPEQATVYRLAATSPKIIETIN